MEWMDILGEGGQNVTNMRPEGELWWSKEDRTFFEALPTQRWGLLPPPLPVGGALAGISHVRRREAVSDLSLGPSDPGGACLLSSPCRATQAPDHPALSPQTAASPAATSESQPPWLSSPGTPSGDSSPVTNAPLCPWEVPGENDLSAPRPASAP